MSYTLESEHENARLEKQSTHRNYSVADELSQIKISPRARVLDAGCGSGILSRHIAIAFEKVSVEACDISRQRLDQAGHQFATAGIRFFHADLKKIPEPPESYDHIFCRFVFQHLDQPEAVASEFFRLLKPGGRVCLIDADGTLFNYYSADPILNNQLKMLQAKWQTDLYIGRKLPSILKTSGFTKINWDIRLMKFKGPDLTDEIDLTRDRLSFIFPTLVQLFGSDEIASDFKRRYVEELSRPETTLYYNKFIVQAEKP